MTQAVSVPSKDCLAEPGRRYWIQLSDINWWLVLLICTLAALQSAGTVYTSDLAQGSDRPYYYPLLWEFSGYYTWFLMLPVTVFAFSRLPIQRQNWFWSVPLHVLISMAIGVTHTLVMLVTRSQLYELFDLGIYQYGHMGYRLLMEYHKQFLGYWVVYTVLRLLAYHRQSRAREREAAELKLKTSELQRQLAQVQLQALRSQLNPHFLFNTLNMVSSVMYEDVDRADHMLAALSRMLRLSLEENVGACVTVRRELEFVQCAVELIQARFQDRVAFDIQCSPEVMDELVPNLVVYTLMENAIKHHDLERCSIIRVQVRIERRDASLDIRVLDNGPGITDLSKAMRNGVGLSNTRQRLEALYDGQHAFEIRNRPEGGLQVHLALPLQRQPKAQPV